MAPRWFIAKFVAYAAIVSRSLDYCHVVVAFGLRIQTVRVVVENYFIRESTCLTGKIIQNETEAGQATSSSTEFATILYKVIMKPKTLGKIRDIAGSGKRLC